MTWCLVTHLLLHISLLVNTGSPDFRGSDCSMTVNCGRDMPLHAAEWVLCMYPLYVPKPCKAKCQALSRTDELSFRHPEKLDDQKNPFCLWN
jgi:hypothetical protein